MAKVKPNEFVVHCIMCGKNFRVGDKAECGGSYNGTPLCSTRDIQRELDSRLPQQNMTANGVGQQGRAEAPGE